MVEDYTDGIKYKLHAHRGRIGDKYSIHLRFDEGDIHLVRLCINGTKHHNYDNTIVSGNHLHVYKLVNEQVEDYAYELSNKPFISTDDLAVAFEKFCSYSHVS